MHLIKISNQNIIQHPPPLLLGWDRQGVGSVWRWRLVLATALSFYYYVCKILFLFSSRPSHHLIFAKRLRIDVACPPSSSLLSSANLLLSLESSQNPERINSLNREIFMTFRVIAFPAIKIDEWSDKYANASALHILAKPSQSRETLVSRTLLYRICNRLVFLYLIISSKTL